MGTNKRLDSMYINDDYFFNQPSYFNKGYGGGGWGMNGDIFDSFFQPAPYHKPRTQQRQPSYPQPHARQQPRENNPRVQSQRQAPSRKRVPARAPQRPAVPREVQEQSALMIQSAFRAYQVRKQNLIEKLSRLDGITVCGSDLVRERRKELVKYIN